MPYLENSEKDHELLAQTTYISGGAVNWTMPTMTTNMTITGIANTSMSSPMPLMKNSVAKRQTTPKGWTKIEQDDYTSMLGGDVFESPVNGRACFIASLTVCNAASNHHWNVFIGQHPEVEYLMCGIAESEGANSMNRSNIIFPREDHFRLFEAWFADYLGMFGTKEILYAYKMPPPPAKMGRSFQIANKTSDLAELMTWARVNCQDRVYLLANMLFFLNEDDLVLYKMKFT